MSITVRRRSWLVLITVALALLSLGACDAEDPTDDTAVQGQARDPDVAEVEDDTFTDEQETVADDQIFGDPASFVNEQLTVQGEVGAVVSDNVFRLDPMQGSSSPLLVAYISDRQSVEVGSTVQVTGVLRDGDPSAIADELGLDVAAVEDTLPGDFVVVASSADDIEVSAS